MGLSDELKAGVGTMWERLVTHPFVIELGEGTLPQATFDIYFGIAHIKLIPPTM